jgi:hypothetical protein
MRRRGLGPSLPIGVRTLLVSSIPVSALIAFFGILGRELMVYVEGPDGKLKVTKTAKEYEFFTKSKVGRVGYVASSSVPIMRLIACVVSY